MTMQNPLFSGSIVALVTPMDNHGNIDFETLKKLIEFHIDAGTDSIVSVGTTGESATLSIEENVKVIEKTVELAKGDVYKRQVFGLIAFILGNQFGAKKQ